MSLFVRYGDQTCSDQWVAKNLQKNLHSKESAKTAKRRDHLLEAAESRLPKGSSQHSEQRNDDVRHLAIKLHNEA